MTKLDWQRVEDQVIIAIFDDHQRMEIRLRPAEAIRAATCILVVAQEELDDEY